MAPRLLLSPAAVRISRPGVNVLSPPSNTPTHLAMSSTWTRVERFHTLAFLPNTSLNDRVPNDSAKTVFYPQLSDYPFARLIARERNSTLTYEEFVGLFRSTGFVSGTGTVTREYPTQHSAVEYTLTDRCRCSNGAPIAAAMLKGGGDQDLLYVSESRRFDYTLMVFKP